jgi:hypothetical protein
MFRGFLPSQQQAGVILVVVQFWRRLAQPVQK